MEHTSTEPWFWILTGPNGAGKSTIASRLCEEIHTRHGQRVHYFNPDEEARKQRIAVSEALLKFYYNTLPLLKRDRRSVMIETTIPGGTSWRLIDDFRGDKYKIGVAAIGVATAQLAQANVARRVGAGGHGVENNSEETTYTYCRMHTPRVLKLADEARIFDSSNGRMTEIASRTDSGTFVMHVPLSTITADENPYMHGIVSDLAKDSLLVVIPNLSAHGTALSGNDPK